MKREDLKILASETLSIVENGCYKYRNKNIDISQLLLNSASNSVYYSQDKVDSIMEQFKPAQRFAETKFLVFPESTVKSALILEKKQLDTSEKIGILNFASARHAGGGFINGAMAQEESLAFSSNLYQCQTMPQCEEYYEANRNYHSSLYTDGMIFSPDTVFFRDENYMLKPVPSLFSVLTCPAVNKGAVERNEKDKIFITDVVMEKRMSKILGMFAYLRYETIILGAYGCGVFKNSPATIAEIWSKLLHEKYNGMFRTVCFAVLDRNKKNIAPFYEYFG